MLGISQNEIMKRKIALYQRKKHPINCLDAKIKKAPSKKLQSYKPEMYLQVTSQVNGSKMSQSQEILAKANQSARNLSTTHLSHYYVRVYNQCSILPKLTYPLAITSLHSKQLNNIHNALYPTVIFSKRFNGHWQKQLKYCHHKYSGIGLLDLEVERGMRKIQLIHTFFHYLKHQTLIHTIVDQYQMSIGLSQPVFEIPHQQSEYVSSV